MGYPRYLMVLCGGVFAAAVFASGGGFFWSVAMTLKQCSKFGCTSKFDGPGSRCPEHKRIQWKKPVNATPRMTGRRLQAARAKLFSEHPLCAACRLAGKSTEATERDHIIPLCNGGADDESNVQALCADCHAVKSKAESASGFARYRARRGGGGSKV